MTNNFDTARTRLARGYGLPIAIAWLNLLLACPAEEENVEVEEWQKQGLVAALTDPDAETRIAGMRLTLIEDSEVSRLGMPDLYWLRSGLSEHTFAPDLKYGPGIFRLVIKELDQTRRMPVAAGIGNLLSYPDVGVVRDAAVALGKLGAKQAIPALEKLLDSDDDDIVRYAAVALGKLGAKDKAIAALEKQLDRDKDHIVGHAAIGLGELGAKDKAIPALEKLLGSGNEYFV